VRPCQAPASSPNLDRVATASRRRLPALLGRRNGTHPDVPIEGPARLGERTKHLVKRLRPGDVAVVDHLNIDRIAAEELIATGVSAVLNASESSNGRYPNTGPLMLARAGIRLIDAPRADLFALLRDGQMTRIEGETIFAGGREVAHGHALEVPALEAQLDEHRQRIDEALAEFAENTVAHVRQETDLLTGSVEFPPTRASFRDRQVLIVVRGDRHRRDLKALRAYIRDMRPLIVAVDGGADGLLEAGLKPDVIFGDMDSASDGALRSGAELIVHAYPDGRAPGCERLVAMGLEHSVVPAAGTSEDVAMLMVYEKGAELIVSVGAHFNLIEFLDRKRGGMSSTFLTRLRIGEKLVDAKGVSRLYQPAPTLAPAALFLLAFLILLAILVITSPVLNGLFQLIWLKIRIWLGA
jgi:uncharacterized membrane-anchored protein